MPSEASRVDPAAAWTLARCPSAEKALDVSHKPPASAVPSAPERVKRSPTPLDSRHSVDVGEPPNVKAKLAPVEVVGFAGLEVMETDRGPLAGAAPKDGRAVITAVLR